MSTVELIRKDLECARHHIERVIARLPDTMPSSQVELRTAITDLKEAEQRLPVHEYLK